MQAGGLGLQGAVGGAWMPSPSVKERGERDGKDRVLLRRKILRIWRKGGGGGAES